MHWNSAMAKDPFVIQRNWSGAPIQGHYYFSTWYLIESSVILLGNSPRTLIYNCLNVEASLGMPCFFRSDLHARIVETCKQSNRKYDHQNRDMSRPNAQLRNLECVSIRGFVRTLKHAHSPIYWDEYAIPPAD